MNTMTEQARRIAELLAHALRDTVDFALLDKLNKDNADALKEAATQIALRLSVASAAAASIVDQIEMLEW